MHVLQCDRFLYQPFPSRLRITLYTLPCSSPLAAAPAVNSKRTMYFVALAEKYGAKALIIVNNVNHSMTMPSANKSEPAASTAQLCMVPAALQDDLLDGTLLSIDNPEPSKLDASFIPIFAMGVATVVLGSVWNTLPDREKALRSGRFGSVSAAPAAPPISDERVGFTKKSVAYFVVLASSFLLLMVYERQYIFYIMVAVFALFGALGLFSSLELLSTLWPSLWRPQITLPRVGNTPIVKVVVAVLSLAIGVLWVVERVSSYSWVLQDVLGIAFMASCTAVLHVSSLKTATIGLGIFLLYDAFFVFITPFIFDSDTSIMEQAATGTPTVTGSDGCVAYDQMLPFLIRVPRIRVPECQCQSDAMLGFGDVVLPSLLVAFCLRFDFSRMAGTTSVGFVARYKYMIAVTIAYSVGLVLAFVAVAYSGAAQPALVYLVPCTLGATFTVAKVNGEVAEMWKGFSTENTRDDNIDNGSDSDEDKEGGTGSGMEDPLLGVNN